MYTQPQLEIYADDVKCSHGATVGQLDDQALFYMQQRGIPAKEARMLLMFAFVDDVINTITHSSVARTICAHWSNNVYVVKLISVQDVLFAEAEHAISKERGYG